MTAAINYQDLAEKIKLWGQSLGFAQLGIADIDLSEHEPRLQAWLDNQYHGEMDYMARHGMMRARPNELEPGTVRVISARMNYLPPNAKFAATLKDKELGYVSRYALGRDYHKLMRKRLQQLGKKIQDYCTEFNFRPFVDSAPVLERPLAEKAGLGWVGKHSLLINQEAGSWFFLGELLVNLPLPVDNAPSNQCGHCVACMKICPTNAIVEPYVVDAKRCISYLTIENQSAIPVEFRKALGNRIYGCDDCQLICPWNKFSSLTEEVDFHPRQQLDGSTLLTLFAWRESEFLSRTEGSPIRRIGYHSWLRNIAVALGNAPFQPAIVGALTARAAQLRDESSEQAAKMVLEHIEWALAEQAAKQHSIAVNVPRNDTLLQDNEANSTSTNHDNANDNKTKRLNQRLIRAIEKGLPRDA
ncbi:tRNA epoxyqueuosine(34) reductase QueG [Thalassotalea euphylliae]|uniref:Epoxyqueuosine reductase n=1 Tax=Thalassotalea euphylliae TaxID=1655234 RepID=A0A3E0TX28_9GAMM|nr:tRNA epoxyqueuosine(34) reductase QueG [Thalassotalea euphylliae]REL28535.1 tRNA epoxyqueuosine(34) reductase QueG [Thalassotalea euphylliae]